MVPGALLPVAFSTPPYLYKVRVSALDLNRILNSDHLTFETPFHFAPDSTRASISRSRQATARAASLTLAGYKPALTPLYHAERDTGNRAKTSPNLNNRSSVLSDRFITTPLCRRYAFARTKPHFTPIFTATRQSRPVP